MRKQNLQAASMSCLAMFQKVALRAFEMKLRFASETMGAACRGITPSCAIVKRDLAPSRCLAHSRSEASRNS